MTKSVGTTMHQALPLKRSADEMENGEKPEETQDKRVNFVSGAEQMAAAAAAAEQQQEGETVGYSVGGEAEGEMEEEDMGVGEDDKSWRERTDLRAVECCERGVQLSTPPFPFYQYWDEQYDTKKKRRERRGERVQRRASPDYTLGSNA